VTVGGNRPASGGASLRLRPSFCDLRFDGGELRPQRLSGLVESDRMLSTSTPTAQLLLELGQVLNGLLGGLEGSRERATPSAMSEGSATFAGGPFRRERCCGLRWSGLWRLRPTGAIDPARARAREETEADPENTVASFVDGLTETARLTREHGRRRLGRGPCDRYRTRVP